MQSLIENYLGVVHEIFYHRRWVVEERQQILIFELETSEIQRKCNEAFDGKITVEIKNQSGSLLGGHR